ncbi:MAG: gliding motility protein GldC [Ignavibacterium sp.]|nr:gliding motility protein GldC [Ignavibacterium sp.]MDW8375714.1 gliding motility protein GldC [Ignavibacteriales bacterium]
MNKVSQIKFLVELDENKIPQKILWQADDADFNGLKEAKSMFLSLWDKQELVTLGMDLWTKEMTIEEMNIHFHQIFVKMAESYSRATHNQEIELMIKKFAADFAQRLNIFNNGN